MNNAINDDLQKVFKSFDVDNSGTIQLNQLIKVAQALGEKMTEEQAKKIIKKIDVNKDGKISLQEFKFWWTKGYKGKLGKLVYLKAKSAKIGNKIMKYLQKNKFASAAPSGLDYKNTCKIQVKFGDEKPNGLGLKLEAYHANKQSQQKIAKITQMIPTLVPENLTIFCVFTTENGTGNKQQILQFINKIKIQKAFDQVQSFEQNPFFSLSAHNYKENKIILKLQIKQELLNVVQGQTQKVENIFDLFAGDDKGLALNVDFQTNFTIDQLLTQKNIIQNLMKGFAFNFRLQLSRKALAKLRQMFEQQITYNFSQKVIPPFFAMLFKNLQIKLKFNSPQKINNFFDKLGISELLKQAPNLSQFLQPFIEDSMFQQIKNDEQNPFNLIYRAIKFIKSYMHQGFQIGFCWKNSCAHLQLNYPGLFKIFDLIFRQK